MTDESDLIESKNDDNQMVIQGSKSDFEEVMDFVLKQGGAVLTALQENEHKSKEKAHEHEERLKNSELNHEHRTNIVFLSFGGAIFACFFIVVIILALKDKFDMAVTLISHAGVAVLGYFSGTRKQPTKPTK